MNDFIIKKVNGDEFYHDIEGDIVEFIRNNDDNIINIEVGDYGEDENEDITIKIYFEDEESRNQYIKNYQEDESTFLTEMV